jgi:hypothetical protein
VCCDGYSCGMEPPDIYSFYEEGANGVSIKSSQGSSTGCVPSGLLRTTIFQVKCDKSIKDMAVIDSIETQGSSGCTYVVNMRSEYGCPIRPKVYTYFLCFAWRYFLPCNPHFFLCEDFLQPICCFHLNRSSSSSWLTTHS